MNYEAGQLLHNNPIGADLPTFAYALIKVLREEIARVYWNTQQRQWRGSPDIDLWDKSSDNLTFDPLPPGITWHPYYNWGGSPEDADWEQAEADKPNFSFEGVEIRWYKHFGRSMNCNVIWSPEKWNYWFERCLQTCEAWESEHEEKSGYRIGDAVPYPDAQTAMSLEVTDDDLRVLELQKRINTLEAQQNMMACVCIEIERGEQPTATPDDWRWCKDLEWIVRLGRHALTASKPFKLNEEEST